MAAISLSHQLNVLEDKAVPFDPDYPTEKIQVKSVFVDKTNRAHRISLHMSWNDQSLLG